MKIRPATPEDIMGINPAPYFEEFVPIWRERMGGEDARDHLRILARSVEIHGRVLAILGINPGPPGVADVWLMMEEKAYAYPVAMAWAVKKLLPITWDMMHCHRLQATVERDSEIEVKTVKLLEYLGFKREGLLENLSPGKDFWLYAKQTRYLQ